MSESVPNSGDNSSPVNPKRLAIGKRLRFQIFARDGFACKYCGRQSDEVKLVVDHVKPVCQGGTNDPENLITSCEPCNQGKGGRTIEQSAPTEETALRLAQERNEQMSALKAAEDAIDARARLEQSVVNFWCEQTGRKSMDRRTLATIMAYVREFGMATVADWISSAAMRTGGHRDDTMGKYISGIRRSVLAEAKF